MEVSFASAVSQKSPGQQNANRKKVWRRSRFRRGTNDNGDNTYFTLPEIALFKFRAPYRKQPDPPWGFLGLLSGSTIAQDLLSQWDLYRTPYSVV